MPVQHVCNTYQKAKTKANNTNRQVLTYDQVHVWQCMQGQVLCLHWYYSYGAADTFLKPRPIPGCHMARPVGNKCSSWNDRKQPEVIKKTQISLTGFKTRVSVLKPDVVTETMAMRCSCTAIFFWCSVLILWKNQYQHQHIQHKQLSVCDRILSLCFLCG